MIDYLAIKIWNYLKLNQPLKRSDCIVVFGSSDVRCAIRGAALFLQRWAPLLVFSGGFGRITRNIWHKSEAEKFAQIAIKMGVPFTKILIENKSTNTGENIIFTRKVLAEKKYIPRTLIAVHKPYMERRTFATFKKLWPELGVVLTSPQIQYAEYPNKIIPKKEVINILVGDLQRLKVYSRMGYQIHQTIPADVWDAYNKLVKLGYTKHLLKDE